MLEKLKEQLVQLHQELPKNDLVRWTGGNVSMRDPETGLVIFKAQLYNQDQKVLIDSTWTVLMKKEG